MQKVLVLGLALFVHYHCNLTPLRGYCLLGFPKSAGWKISIQILFAHLKMVDLWLIVCMLSVNLWCNLLILEPIATSDYHWLIYI